MGNLGKRRCCFISIPNSTIKTVLKVIGVDISKNISIPNSTIKTQQRIFLLKICPISIPNSTIKTHGNGASWSWLNPFQFLIVRLRLIMKPIFHFTILFQFLIVRLRLTALSRTIRTSTVSIPNSTIKTTKKNFRKRLQKVSIPNSTIKTALGLRVEFSVKRFQFLIVRLRPRWQVGI